MRIAAVGNANHHLLSDLLKEASDRHPFLQVGINGDISGQHSDNIAVCGAFTVLIGPPERYMPGFIVGRQGKRCHGDHKGILLYGIKFLHLRESVTINRENE